MKMNRVAAVVTLCFAAGYAQAGFVDSRSAAAGAQIEVAYKSVTVSDLVTELVPSEFATSYATPDLANKTVSVTGKGTWNELLARAIEPAGLHLERKTDTAGNTAVRIYREEPKAAVATAPAVATLSASADKSAASVATAPAPAPEPVWSLTAGHMIRTELQAWGTRAGWKVIWNMRKDWTVPASTTYQGDFKKASTNVIKTLAANGALIHAQFFDGNRTLLVTGPGSASQ